MTDILTYAKEHVADFEKGGVSSNEIRFFEVAGQKYVLKTPLMVGENLSPFWLMMKRVFHFTFERQSENLKTVYDALATNPYIPVAPFLAADHEAMIYAFTEGEHWDEDNFPDGVNNAYRLGQYLGYNHRVAHKNCGLLGVEDVEDFFSAALTHMGEVIKERWNSDSALDQAVRRHYDGLKKKTWRSARYSLIMTDFSADQFLYHGEEIAACVDLDAYVVAPIEWELAYLRTQVRDWDAFTAGYEQFQPLPALDELPDFFMFLMELNPYWDKSEMEELLASID